MERGRCRNHLVGSCTFLVKSPDFTKLYGGFQEIVMFETASSLRSRVVWAKEQPAALSSLRKQGPIRRAPSIDCHSPSKTGVNALMVWVPALRPGRHRSVNDRFHRIDPLYVRDCSISPLRNQPAAALSRTALDAHQHARERHAPAIGRRLHSRNCIDERGPGSLHVARSRIGSFQDKLADQCRCRLRFWWNIACTAIGRRQETRSTFEQADRARRSRPKGSDLHSYLPRYRRNSGSSLRR